MSSEDLIKRLGEGPEQKLLSESTIQELSFDVQQVMALCKASLDFLAGIAMPTVYQYSFPDVYIAVWQWLVEHSHKVRDFSQLALGLPRGFGKTMMIKLFILYAILFTTRKFILVLCENQTKANNILADVADMLNEHNIKTVFGNWQLGIETDRLDMKKFGYRGRNVILMAGTVEVIRGITLKNERPDIMIFDDIQSRICAESQIQSENLEREMTGTAMKAKSPHGCLFVFIGNMYPTKWSILRKLKRNPNWLKFIAGGIKSDGTSLWEELQPIQQLMREYENDLAMGRPEVFFAEVLNDETASQNSMIDLSKIPPLPYSGGDIPEGKFIIIDPSSGKITSDSVAIGLFEVYDTIPALARLKNDRYSPGDTIREAIKMALENDCRLICIESVAYQSTLGYWFKVICDQMGIIGIECVEIYPGGFSKNSRILSMFKALVAGELCVSEECRAEVYLQIMQWNPLRRDNVDDILDLLAYAPKVLELYGEYVVCWNQIYHQDNCAIPVLPAEVNCCF